MLDRGCFNFICLNNQSEKDVSAYERSLYKAFFQRDTINPDMDFDRKNHSARTKIEYQYQDIFVVKLHDSITAAMALNYNMKNLLQLELEGFSINKNEPNSCEVLHLFALNEQVLCGKPLLETLANFAFEKIIAAGKQIIYATCSERRLRSYQSLGFELIDKNDLPGNGEETFLLKLNIDKGVFANRPIS